ncbi:hypothetical protein [Rhizobium sp. BR 315]|uniref:hypothetical protein n=1 Tax=Rhizobium sp. BR 315 TaxID=3040014 RepID=UPI003D32F526
MKVELTKFDMVGRRKTNTIAFLSARFPDFGLVLSGLRLIESDDGLLVAAPLCKLPNSIRRAAWWAIGEPMELAVREAAIRAYHAHHGHIVV